jgi:hypothetical protein
MNRILYRRITGPRWHFDTEISIWHCDDCGKRGNRKDFCARYTKASKHRNDDFMRDDVCEECDEKREHENANDGWSFALKRYMGKPTTKKEDNPMAPKYDQNNRYEIEGRVDDVRGETTKSGLDLTKLIVSVPDQQWDNNNRTFQDVITVLEFDSFTKEKTPLFELKGKHAKITFKLKSGKYGPRVSMIKAERQAKPEETAAASESLDFSTAPVAEPLSAQDEELLF